MARRVFRGINRYTSIGTYPVFFIVNSFDIVCWECIQNNGYELEKEGSVIENFVNREQDICCEHCGDYIERAYFPGDEEE